MKRPLSFLAGWLVLGASLALAQSPGSGPKSPVLPRTPAFSSWTMQFKYKDEEKAAVPDDKPQYFGDRIRSVTVTKTNKTYWERTTLTSGKTYEKWVFDDVQLQTLPDSAAIFPIPPPTKDSPEPYYSDYSQGDFPELKGVSPANFKGIQKNDGREVYAFEVTRAGSTITVFLSVDTQMPVSVSDGDSVCTYIFNAAPSGALAPPERFLDVLRRHKKGLEALKYRPSLP